ncbi:protein of unknown function [Aminobacter niigataensis]|nr:protein of unknown function [Aminobacter niigataensis]
MRIPLQHLPVLVPGNECNLLDCESGLEKSACAFVSQVVEVKVVDTQVGASATKSCAD